MKTTLISIILFVLFYYNVSAQCTPNAGSDDIGCGLTYFLQGTISQSNSTVLWTSTNPSVIFSDATQPTTTVIIPNWTGTTYTISFTLTETNTFIPCSASDIVTITFHRPPMAIIDQQTVQSACGTSSQLSADTVGSGITNGWWTCTVPSVTITPIGSDPKQWNSMIDISTIGSGMWINSQRQIFFIYHGQNSLGCTSTDTVLVTFYEIPSNTYGGSDTSVCGKTIILNGDSSIENSAGRWSLLTPAPGSVNFIPGNSTYGIGHIPQVTVSQFGMYNFIFKEMNQGMTVCFDYDTISVEFKVTPAPDAGLNSSVCGQWANICATPSVFGGYWNCPQGGVTFYDQINGTNTPSNANSPCTVIRYNSPNQIVTMYWNEFNGYCNGYDSVNVYFQGIQPAVQLVDPADSLVCGPSYTLLNAQQPAFGTGYWFDTVMNTHFTPSPINTTPVATIDTGSFDYYGWHHFYWVTVNSNCRDTSDVVRVFFMTNRITGIAQSSLVSNFSNFKAELIPEINYNNTSLFSNTLSSNGSFSFWTLPNQNYYLKISSNNPSLYPTIANTYYNNSYNWQNATILTNTVNCDTINVTIPLITYVPATGGNCRIYGLVRYDSSFEPVTDATVYLRYQPNQDPARFEFTNQNGYYSVNNVPNGNYKLFVDIPGLPQITNHHIVVNPNDTVFANVNFIVDTTSITKQYGFGIYADSTGFISVSLNDFSLINISTFPNPFNEYISINGNLNHQENISVEILDNAGKIINCFPEKIFTTGKFNFSLPVSFITKGIYYLKISVGETVYIKKISKL